MYQIHKKLVEGELWAEVTGVTIWGHINPSSLQVQKTNRMKYDTKTKMVSYDLAHTR